MKTIWIRLEPIEFYRRVKKDASINEYIISDIGDSTYYYNAIDKSIMLSIESNNSPFDDIVISKEEFFKIVNITLRRDKIKRLKEKINESEESR
jgi:hypothetical protein